jgi:large subunit ribosomal protein L13
MNKTLFKTPDKETHKWYLIDAESKKLGRLSSEISKILLGKNKPYYSPNTDIKHSIIVINAEKVEVTGKKRTDKFYRRHSGRPGGLTIETFQELQNRIPNRIIEKSVKGMLPKTRLGRSLFGHLKVYSGNVHPHASQNPEVVILD